VHAHLRARLDVGLPGQGQERGAVLGGELGEPGPGSKVQGPSTASLTGVTRTSSRLGGPLDERLKPRGVIGRKAERRRVCEVLGEQPLGGLFADITVAAGACAGDSARRPPVPHAAYRSYRAGPRPT
jgi:hypothetical protein